MMPKTKLPYQTKECAACWFNIKRWLLMHDLEYVKECPCCGADMVDF